MNSTNILNVSGYVHPLSDERWEFFHHWLSVYTVYWNQKYQWSLTHIRVDRYHGNVHADDVVLYFTATHPQLMKPMQAYVRTSEHLSEQTLKELLESVESNLDVHIGVQVLELLEFQQAYIQNLPTLPD